jgi:hypothetical protein
VSASVTQPPPGSLLFRWERPRPRRFAIAGFILISAALHALCFYIFQVVYPPVISLLPPPAQVSVIAPTSGEAQTFLTWLNAEDPALASETQRPADARAFQLPKIAHVPSYVAVPPTLKEWPKPPVTRAEPIALPPAAVPDAAPPAAFPPVIAPTVVAFSEPLRSLTATLPSLKFRASSRDTPESARFRLAVDSLGAVRYIFLEQSSGDAALDSQARQNLALCRFRMGPGTAGDLVWAIATFRFGTDLEAPPSPSGHAP